MNCKHCKRPMRRRREERTDQPGTVEHNGGGYCSTCVSHRRKFGTLDGWLPGKGRSEDRLTEYAELRAMNLTRQQCADRMHVGISTLERLLARHKDDPRSDAGYGQIKSRNKDIRKHSPIGPLDIDADTKAKATSTVCARLGMSEARTVLAMLGIAS